MQKRAHSSAVQASQFDLGSLRIKIDSPITGFQHVRYPIYLNQNQFQMPLSVRYTLFGTIGRVPNSSISDPSVHGIRVEPILRYGRVPVSVPQPGSTSILRIVAHKPVQIDDFAVPASLSQHEELASAVQPPAHSCCIKFHISKDCLSDGGFETTVRLRLLVIRESLGLVLAFADSSRFAVMTRDAPSGPNLLARLRAWGFPIHPDDQESKAVWKSQMKPTGKRSKLVEPVAYEVDDEQTLFEPLSICLPSGQSYLTIAGVSKVVDLIRGGTVSFDHDTISLLSLTFPERSSLLVPPAMPASSRAPSDSPKDVEIDTWVDKCLQLS
jgi:hypothetical protein